MEQQEKRLEKNGNLLNKKIKMKKFVTIIILSILFVSCSNIEKEGSKKEINRLFYTVNFKYNTNLNDTIYVFKSLKELYPENHSVFLFIYGVKDSLENYKYSNQDLGYIMESREIEISQTEFVKMINKGYTPSISVLNIDKNHITKDMKWTDTFTIVDSLVYDFTIINLEDFKPLKSRNSKN